MAGLWKPTEDQLCKKSHGGGGVDAEAACACLQSKCIYHYESAAILLVARIWHARIYPKPRTAPPLRQAFAAAAQQKAAATETGPSVLPIILPPATLRPIAFRTLTKKHNLTLTSSGLGSLATFVGRFCGSGWRDEGLAEKVLDEVAKQWKRQGAGIIVEDGPDNKLTTLLKLLEPCMLAGKLDAGKLSRTNSSTGTLSRQTSLEIRPDLSRDDSQTSFGMSGLDVQEEQDLDDDLDTRYADARPFIKVISAFKQPRLSYSVTKKTIETVSAEGSLLPPLQQKIAMFRNRYHIIHQRLLRNESFQTPSFAGSRPPHLQRAGSSISQTQSYKITPVSNLLGRSGSEHLLLGMLAHTPASDSALADLSGSVVLDMRFAQAVPRDGVFFTPGMMVLVEGTYEEDGSNNSNLGSAGGVGGQIKGRFVAKMISGPPTERRDVTTGIGQSQSSDHIQTSVGAGFGWIDFLGVGSEKATGPQMRRLQRRLMAGSSPSSSEQKRSKVAIVSECHLDSPRTLDALRAVLNSYTVSGDSADLPLSVVLMGNFLSSAAMAGSSKAGSVEYKEYFDSLASMLAEYPKLISSTTFVFVPGDNDPWASTFSAGASTIIPRQGLPDLLTSRVRRAFATANNEQGAKDGQKGEAIFTSNPARISVFGPVEELVLFRDDISGRMRRNAITFADPESETAELDGPAQADAMDLDIDAVKEAASHVPKAVKFDVATQIGRRITKTLLDQSHLSPFPLSLRPVAWDFAASLSLYPLPSVLVIADAEAPQFCVTYEGCSVMNPGRLLERGAERRGICRWVEYEIGNGGRSRGKGSVKEARF
ncbi:DNA polymerase epsilon subunit B [Cyphellophora attinorum]|uniref:DNA polymerase epsilon subunit B n=1 Tax=Cyphellophora attinorum TaxID=1664694 RepID=A0A0N0NM07_9EURO|nr:DNA polymerase epsilon subunit B [Phialophora attinorum]KPI39911.1 DNA polymerase epsilon subunit B [Phialophora attinorum]